MRRALLAAAFLAAALSGCAGPAALTGIPVPEPGPLAQPGVPGTGFFALDHPGGDLEFRLDGILADVTLYSARDVRLGGFRIEPGVDAPGAGSTGTWGDQAFRFRNVGAGELVAYVRDLEGDLTALAGTDGTGPGLWFERLPAHVERIPLANASSAPGLGLMGRDIPQQEIRLDGRPPAGLQVLLDGSAEEVRVRLASRLGLVLATDAGAAGSIRIPLVSDGLRLEPLPSTFHDENVLDGRLTGVFDARGLEGVLVLEATTYSRARPQAEVEPQPGREPAFRYGTVGPGPAWVDVAEGATRLALFRDAPGVGEAWAAVFGPDDRRLATVRIVDDEVLHVLVPGPGAYVIAPIAGTVGVGVDRLGEDFELHALDTRVTSVAGADPGPPYKVETRTLTVEGVPFRLGHAWEDGGGPLPFFTCTSTTFVALRQDGETLTVNGTTGGLPMPYAAALLDGPTFEVVTDGAGDGCMRPALHVESYVRPAAPEAGPRAKARPAQAS